MKANSQDCIQGTLAKNTSDIKLNHLTFPFYRSKRVGYWQFHMVQLNSRNATADINDFLLLT